MTTRIQEPRLPLTQIKEPEQLRGVLAAAKERAETGDTRELFTFVKVNRLAAEMAIEDPALLPIRATHGVDEKYVLTMLDEMAAPAGKAGMVEGIIHNNIQPNWTLAHQISAMSQVSLANRRMRRMP